MRIHLTKLAAITAVSIFSFQALADGPASIEEIMENVEKEVKVVQENLDNRDMNKDSVARSLNMRKLFIHMYSFVPKKLHDAKPEEKPALTRAYDKFVAQEIALLSDLEGNFAADKNEDAKKTFDEIGKIRRSAHKLFK